MEENETTSKMLDGICDLISMTSVELGKYTSILATPTDIRDSKRLTPDECKEWMFFSDIQKDLLTLYDKLLPRLITREARGEVVY